MSELRAWRARVWHPLVRGTVGRVRAFTTPRAAMAFAAEQRRNGYRCDVWAIDVLPLGEAEEPVVEQPRPPVVVIPPAHVKVWDSVGVLAPSVGGWWHVAQPHAEAALCGAEVVAPYVARASWAALRDALRDVEGCLDCYAKVTARAAARHAA